MVLEAFIEIYASVHKKALSNLATSCEESCNRIAAALLKALWTLVAVGIGSITGDFANNQANTIW